MDQCATVVIFGKNSTSLVIARTFGIFHCFAVKVRFVLKFRYYFIMWGSWSPIWRASKLNNDLWKKNCIFRKFWPIFRYLYDTSPKFYRKFRINRYHYMFPKSSHWHFYKKDIFRWLLKIQTISIIVGISKIDSYFFLNFKRQRFCSFID